MKLMQNYKYAYLLIYICGFLLKIKSLVHWRLLQNMEENINSSCSLFECEEVTKALKIILVLLHCSALVSETA